MTVGDTVEWTSQAAGVTRTKRGVIIEVVPGGRDPLTKLVDIGSSRRRESYVVRASVVGKTKTKLYWPNPTALKKVVQP